jgi:hypothetical protein
MPPRQCLVVPRGCPRGGPVRSALGAQVDDPAGLADRTLDATGRADLDLRGGADVVLDPLADPLLEVEPVGVATIRPSARNVLTNRSFSLTSMLIMRARADLFMTTSLRTRPETNF